MERRSSSNALKQQNWLICLVSDDRRTRNAIRIGRLVVIAGLLMCVVFGAVLVTIAFVAPTVVAGLFGSLMAAIGLWRRRRK
ncbi:hypothetical protein G3I59_39435 [Amycolatopsis rubida]|uniref:DUF3040 domain-containing protein n=1 Tax=Amycolatopsis rubida TaxID=112413 RepID=A0ABX0C4L1_9PSEU|nr:MULTISPECIES: hypothetical protein [Amycolatopsis]MYW96527.1 hypothetical protein [Amycolatopsis rubida]NEC61512.1 hypothetical protein [Amycolatopsis rubida]OAP25853.1 hypothetical protein A4R44_03229 [Amycolatopsis sp. M39]